MNIALPGIEWLQANTIARLEKRCETLENDIISLHNTLCLLDRRIAILEGVTPVIKPPDPKKDDDEGWTVVERRRRS